MLIFVTMNNINTLVQDDEEAMQVTYASMSASESTWPIRVKTLRLQFLYDLTDMSQFAVCSNVENFAMENTGWECDFSALVKLTKLKTFVWRHSNYTEQPPFGSLHFLEGSRDSIKFVDIICVGCEQEGVDLTPLLACHKLEVLDISHSYVYRAQLDQLAEQLPNLKIDGIKTARFL